MTRGGIARHVPEQTGDPRMARVLALFGAINDWACGDNFTGCTFINTSAEYSRLLVVAHTERGENIRIISARPANGRETAIYLQSH